MSKNILYLLAILILSGCADQFTIVSFSEPQPAGKKPLPAFPAKLKGKYISNDETVTLYIYDDLMIGITDYDSGIKKAELDTNYYLSGTKLIGKTSGTQEEVILRGDSILVHIHDVDTISNIAAGDVLKKFKGYYFLNQGNKANGWLVTRLALTGGKLTTAYVSDSTAIVRLNELA